MSLRHQFNILGSVLASTAAVWRGGAARKAHRELPALPPILFDIENCPFCRLVREAATDLHLDLDIRPCPKGGKRFRPEAARLGGKLQFPLLMDPNTGVVLYESDAIIDYFYNTYANRPVPSMYQVGKLNKLTSLLATAARGRKGLKAVPSMAPELPLLLWSFEASPYSRPVRERLCELEIPYRLHNLGKEHWTEIGPAVQRIKPGPYKPIAGGKRDAFMAQYGRVQVPYLEDPNTGAKLFESEAILAYLNTTYAR
ncbi:MAG: glutathione S-transferase [Acinetobacter sp.]|nr:glutathione S-transferase [Acinetobacter sp.]MDO9622310.1 glutathione S-transferase N-terminal domain-containing protein [Moraxellaceae bacterium]